MYQSNPAFHFSDPNWCMRMPGMIVNKPLPSCANKFFQVNPHYFFALKQRNLLLADDTRNSGKSGVECKSILFDKQKVTQKSPLDRKGNKKEISLLSAYLWILNSFWNETLGQELARPSRRILFDIFVPCSLKLKLYPEYVPRGMTDCANAYRQVGRRMATSLHLHRALNPLKSSRIELSSFSLLKIHWAWIWTE